MTTYQVQDPQGGVHEFEGPAGATPEQILSVAQQQFGQAAPPQSDSDRAFNYGREQGASEPGLIAGASQAAQQATFGGMNYVNAGARYVAQRAAGVDHPDDFAGNLAYARGKSEGEAEGHRIASTVGGTGGALLAGGAIGSALKGTRFAALLAAKQGQKVANVAKSVATNAAIGGTTAINNGDSLPDAARTAAFSGVVGPVLQKGATFALSKLQPAAARAMQTLASTLGETPQVLQHAYQAFQQLTGRVPSMAELVGLKSQGKLRDLAKANPTISEAAITAADLGGQPLHEQLNTLNAHNASVPQTGRAMTELRDRDMDTHMNTPHPQTGLTLNDTPVNDHTGLMMDPRVDYALRPNDRLNARLGNVTPQGLTGLQHRIQTNTATIGDIEVVRKSLRDMQTQLMRPSAGSLHARDPIAAKEFGNLAQQIEGLGVHTDKDYGLALDNYRAGSQYIDSFQHGLSGKAVNDVATDDPMLAKSLASQPGQHGYQHGNALNTAQQALSAVAPGHVAQPTDAVGARHAAQAAAAATTGGLNAVVHGLRALPVVGDRLPEKVQQIIAKQLFDPRTTQQGINNLRRAGAQDRDIRAIGAAMGGVAGQRVADYLSQQGQ